MSADPDLILLADAHLAGNAAPHQTRLLGEIVSSNPAAAQELAGLCLTEALLNRPRMSAAQLDRLLDRRTFRPAAAVHRTRLLWISCAAAAAVVAVLLIQAWRSSGPEQVPVADGPRPRPARQIVGPPRPASDQPRAVQPADESLLDSLKSCYIPLFEANNLPPEEVCRSLLGAAAALKVTPLPDLAVKNDSGSSVKIFLANQSVWTLLRITAFQCGAEPFLDGSTLRFRRREWSSGTGEFEVASLRKIFIDFLPEIAPFGPAELTAEMEEAAAGVLRSAFGPDSAQHVRLTMDVPLPAFTLGPAWARQTAICLEGAAALTAQWQMTMVEIQTGKDDPAAAAAGIPSGRVTLIPESAVAALLRSPGCLVVNKSEQMTAWTLQIRSTTTAGPGETPADWSSLEIAMTTALSGRNLQAGFDVLWRSAPVELEKQAVNLHVEDAHTVLIPGPDTAAGRPALLVCFTRGDSTAQPAAKAVVKPAPKAPPEKKDDIPSGIPVPGKPGFVYSPFAPDQGLVDVEGIPSRTKVRCPYTGQTFRAP